MLLAGLLLVGCAGERVVVERAGDTVALVDARVGGGMDAQIRGVLARTAGGCLGVDDGQGRVRPAVWPPGSDVTDAGDLVTPAGAVIALGDRLAGSGGEIPDLSREIDDPPPACTSHGASAVVLWEVEPA